MAFIDLDLDSEGFETVPPGQYVLRIVNTTIEKVKDNNSKNFGMPLVNWEFEVIAPDSVVDPLTGEEKPTSGKKLFRRTPAWKGAGGFLKAVIDACGATELMGPTGVDTSLCHGRTLGATVTNELYNDQMQARISKFHKLN